MEIVIKMIEKKQNHVKLGSSSNSKKRPVAQGSKKTTSTKKTGTSSNNRTTNSTSKKPETKKTKKNKKDKFSGRHPKLMLAIKIMIVLFLLLCVVGAGIVAGIFFGLK